jgi:two-component system sensor histidine kinase KdpD
MLTRNLNLARDLGAEVISTQDTDVGVAIERIARQKQITQIIVGRSPQKPFLGLFGRKSLVDKLETDCKDLDIHVIRQNKQERTYKGSKHKNPTQWASYGLMFCWVVLFTLINMLLAPYIGYKIVGFLFLLGIIILSLFFTKGPVLFGAVLYGIIWDYFFIPPVSLFEEENSEDSALLLLYVLCAIVTGILIDRARVGKEMLLKREETSHALYEIGRLISSSPSSSEIVEAVKAYLEGALPGTFHIMVKDPRKGIDFEKELNAKEAATAAWVFENGKEAGWSTDTLPASRNLYIPLKGYKNVVGVLTYCPQVENEPLTFQEKNFLYAAGQQLAYYLERHFSEEQARQKELLEQVEMIYKQVSKTFPVDITAIIKEQLQKPKL